MAIDSKDRFSQRAEHYDRYRPRYPKGILSFMERELGFTSKSIVADIGSGTGILSELFAENGNTVFGVEPNGDMRRVAEAKFVAHGNFRSISGSAESTSLANASVNFITAGQSFHWFKPSQARQEFRRILRKGGWVVLVWNTRKKHSTPFLEAYDELTGEPAIETRRGKRDEEVLEMALKFLGPHREAILPNFQSLDHEGLVGRLLSASYVPLPGEPLHEETFAKVSEIFDKYQTNGAVRLEYETVVYAGQLQHYR